MRAFETAIEHLDDVGAWVALLFERARVAEERRRGFDEAITARMERIEARLAAGRAAGQPLPWDRIRVALGLKPSEQMALQVVVAIELLPSLRARMRELAADPSRVWPDVSLLAELVYAAPAARPRLLEVNYLLQRMEAFHGISILTTNLDASIDEAFRRRLSARIHFPMPESEERLRLWRAMIPIKASIAPDIDFDLLSEHYAMSGGHIRNAVIRAAFLAAADRSSITMRHLNRAAALEYAAMGKVMHGSPM